MGEELSNLRAIFLDALEIQDPEQQKAYLAQTCKGDGDLRAEVEALLEAHAAAGDFLDNPAVEPEATLDRPHQVEGPGTRIGRYELLELIGEGGMGLVYLAEQKEPVTRRVALKILKPGMDSAAVIARFEAERQALALLDHPNIAQVFDAGTTDTGRPYFVMEYVRGIAITRYCDERRLRVEQRLRLFEHVCEGIHHAHQKGIIHRDIKPSNILVSVHGDRAVPKIIDFGIAKATTRPLTDKTVFTQQSQLLGTPEYMSPEQVDLSTQDIDIRSDIYSLGVVLYELLAGVLPFERESLARLGFAEVQRTIREQEPLSPSIRFTGLGEMARSIAESRQTHVVALARRLHRELEWIPLKAMRKDRCRRYRSGAEMADDIRNYLDGLPLVAGPETIVYRVKKFAAKHTGAVATVALVTMAIVLGLIGTTVMYLRAERMRTQAEKARTEEAVARKLAEDAEAFAQRQRGVVERRAEDYRRSLYANRIALADVAYERGNIDRLHELLGLCPEDLRGWEWDRLKHVSNQSYMTLQGHARGIWVAAISPDGTRIAAAGKDNVVVVWDAKTGVELLSLKGHEAEVGPIAFSPDGTRIASCDRGPAIKLWDAMSGTELTTLRPDSGKIWSVAYSPDAERLVSGHDDKTIRVWDAVTGAELVILRGHAASVWSTVFSPDGLRIVSGGGDGSIYMWDVRDGTRVMTFAGHRDRVYAIAFSADGTQIVSASQDKVAKIWNVETGREIASLHGHADGVHGVAFSPNDKYIVSGSWDRTIKIWDVSTRIATRTLRGHSRGVYSVAFSPDGKFIVSGSKDGTVRLWDATISRAGMPFEGEYCIMFSSDGKRIASDGHGGCITLWDTRTGVEVMTFAGHWDRISSIAFTPDDSRMISGSFDKQIKIWEVSTGKELRTLTGNEDCVWALAVSPDGTRIVSASWGPLSLGPDCEIKIWDADTGEVLRTLKGHTLGVHHLAYDSQGKRILSSSFDVTQRMWDIETGDEIMRFAGQGCAIFSPDDKRIIAGQGNGQIKIWDVASRSEVADLRGHGDRIPDLAVSPDGRRIASGSLDNTVKVWDMTTGTEVMTISASAAVRSVEFSPNGESLAFSCSDGHATLLESSVPAGGYEPRRLGAAARELVDEMREAHGSYSDVIRQLEDDGRASEPVGELAIQIAHARL